MMKKLLCGAIAFGLMGSMGVAQAASISGTTNFRVTIPEILVLYHWDDAHLVLTGPDSDAIGSNVTHSTTKVSPAVIGSSSHTINGVALDSSSTLTLPSKVDVRLEGAWAVRSISSGGTAGPATKKVTLAVSEQNGSYTLKNVHDNQKTITLTGVKLQPTGSTTTDAASTIYLDPGWNPAKTGDITFIMDLSGLTTSGEYNSHGAVETPATNAANTGDTFKLTLTGAP